MRYLIFYCAVVLSHVVLAQGPVANLPTVIPPSPEVAQLAKIGFTSNSLHTGSANASIPLYSFSVNNVAVTAALSYASNGVKVDDIPSRVGIGWNLIAGGQVSRVVHDSPDDDPSMFLAPPADLSTFNSTLREYLTTATSHGYDTEYDKYSYSFNGQSGKFYLDANGNGIQITKSDLKIKVNGYNTSSKSVEIITPDGVIYEFGLTKKEKTKTIDVKLQTFTCTSITFR